MTPVVRQLIFANVAIFVVQNLVADRLLTHFALWPLGTHFVSYLGRVGFEPWQLVTSAFLHGNLPHIALGGFAVFAGFVLPRWRPN